MLGVRLHSHLYTEGCPNGLVHLAEGSATEKLAELEFALGNDPQLGQVGLVSSGQDGHFYVHFVLVLNSKR